MKKQNKNIPTLPEAGVTIVGIIGVQNKRVSKQIQLNREIESNVEFNNTFLVVKGLKLDVILGGDFFEKI